MNHLPVITPTLFESLGFIRCAVSTRRGGVSPEPFGMNLSFSVGDEVANVRDNRRMFFEAVGCNERSLAQPRQGHSANTAVALEAGWYDKADALITNRPGLWLGISVADCLPVFLVDPVRKAVGAVHAGWRGTVGRIVQNAVRSMQRHYGCEGADLLAYLGPSARACCYEVGPEVATQFNQEVVERRDGAIFLDLVKENVRQLTHLGVLWKHIEVSDLCTITETDLLHSYRREGSRSGRMLGLIAIRSATGI
jgi:YfiH family protein